ncbi:ligand-binding sensor domain-containing protein [Saccharicrinis fermentans]|uniref:Response regulator containing a CheY-like receiver domain and a GGDEF domain protein n=1 Tax=Saccharicrinis fermentans DSM 9555 = JCM 21142 TaxID=869213 RepID=W7YPH7_9BACT|nr:hypothetical protein [Saccharicrinis fermentans]GAF04279.1 response regulator containing a CheY-like receiver domain and a GGDEF domain protein [Saccharicrinis fermentans DSM 9555 = JCM 21142]
MNLKLDIILLLTLSIAPQLLISQNIPYQGTPYIENFNPNSQNTRGQILTIAQDQRGIMYFGGKNGLYEFDGASWRNYPISNKTSIKSLAIDSLGIIYAGGNNDFGVFMPNATGSLEYHSLYLPAPKGAPFFQSIMKTFITDQGVYFISKKRIFRYKNNSIEVIHVNLQAPCAFFVNGTIYVKDLAKGLCKIDETQIIPLEGCEEFNALTKSYFFINSYSDNELLFSLIKENLFFTYNTVSHVLKPFTISDDTKRYLEENFQFTSTQTARGDFAIGTAKGGILLMNKKGETIRIINTNRGLSTNLIYSVFSDAEDNLWASSFKGVSRIDISHPAIFYNKNQGLESNVVCSKYHNNTQYIGTNTNFYYLPEHNFSVSNDNHVIKRIKPPP